MLRFKSDLFRDAIKRMKGGESVAIGSTDATFKDWLSKRKLPRDLAHFLLENAVNGSVSFDGLGGMWTPDEVMSENDREKAVLNGGLFALGSATTGDYLAIDFAQGGGTAGFVSHDLLWEKEYRDVRDTYLPVARSIGELLHGLTNTDLENFPCDYWYAKDYPTLFDADVPRKPRERL